MIEKLGAALIVIGECGADILITPKGIIKVDNPLGEYYSNIPLAHTHIPSISRTDKQNNDFTSTALHLFYLWYTFILLLFKYYRGVAQIENIPLTVPGQQLFVIHDYNILDCWQSVFLSKFQQ